MSNRAMKFVKELVGYTIVGTVVGLYGFHLGKKSQKEIDKVEIELLKADSEIARAEGYLNGMKYEQEWNEAAKKMRQLISKAKDTLEDDEEDE